MDIQHHVVEFKQPSLSRRLANELVLYFWSNLRTTQVLEHVQSYL